MGRTKKLEVGDLVRVDPKQVNMYSSLVFEHEHGLGIVVAVGGPPGAQYYVQWQKTGLTTGWSFAGIVLAEGKNES